MLLLWVPRLTSIGGEKRQCVGGGGGAGKVGEGGADEGDATADDSRD